MITFQNVTATMLQVLLANLQLADPKPTVTETSAYAGRIEADAKFLFKRIHVTASYSLEPISCVLTVTASPSMAEGHIQHDLSEALKAFRVG